jgi:hypothetical protein
VSDATVSCGRWQGKRWRHGELTGQRSGGADGLDGRLRRRSDGTTWQQPVRGMDGVRWGRHDSALTGGEAVPSDNDDLGVASDQRRFG